MKIIFQPRIERIMEPLDRFYLKHGPWNFFKKCSHIISFDENRYRKVLEKKVLIWIELIKYKNKDFLITRRDILFINIK